MWIYFIISAIVIVPGLFALLRYGLKPSIDFTGGALLELSVPRAESRKTIEDAAEKISLPIVSIQQTESGSYIIRLKPEESDKTQSLFKEIEGAVLLRNETVGPVLGKELLQKALVAAVLAIAGILLYVAYAFKNLTYGISAVVALFHDLLVVIGSFALLGVFKGVEVDTLFVTAVLTTMSFSVHDTIVVFDRIREMKKRGVKGNIQELADMALTQTMSRSLANSVTIIIMLLSLVLLGGESVRWFAVALLIGTVSGTYSSPFVATPVFLLLRKVLKEK